MIKGDVDGCLRRLRFVWKSILLGGRLVAAGLNKISDRNFGVVSNDDEAAPFPGFAIGHITFLKPDFLHLELPLEDGLEKKIFFLICVFYVLKIQFEIGIYA